MRRCQLIFVRRFVAAVAVGGLAFVSAADGSPRVTFESSVSEGVRTRTEQSSTRAARYPLRMRREAIPFHTGSVSEPTALERRHRPARIHHGAASEELRRTQARNGIRRQSAPEGIRVVDRPYAAESLQGLLRAEEAAAQADTASGSSSHELRADAMVVESGATGDVRHVQDLAQQNDILENDSVTATGHAAVANGMRVETAREALGDVATRHVLGSEARSLESTTAYTTHDVHDRATPSHTSVSEARHGIRTDNVSLASGQTDGVYGTASAATASGVAAVDAAGATSRLLATARINESIGTGNTFVVLTVTNTGTETVSSPVVRMTLPVGVKYEGLAFAPPGTAAAVTETATGRAVDVVLPMAVPSGQGSRVMVYLSPADAVQAHDLNAQAFPQGHEAAASTSRYRRTATPLRVNANATHGTSKDP